MPANSGLPDNSQQISVFCDCGKKILANATQSGKRLKCPSCGQLVFVLPARAGKVAKPTRAAPAPHPETGNRRSNVLLWTVLWSLPVVVAIGGGAFIHFNAKWRQQARIDAANTEVREAVKGADGWLKQGGAQEAENVEQRLIVAMAANDVSEKANADAVLETVRTRRAELAADSIFDSAKTRLDAKAIDEAVALLQQYVADPHATKKPEAEELLADCDLATSETAALQTLMALSDEQFVQFSDTGKLDDGEISHPVLLEIQATTLRRNLEAANQRREENKLAEANRQESERLALEAARRPPDNATGPPGTVYGPGGTVYGPPGQSANAAVESIRARLIGRWCWGDDLDFSIRFVLDGRYVGKGPSGETSRGEWSVNDDGTIRLRDYENPVPPVVRMNLNEDKLSIRITTGDGLKEVAASRSKESGMNRAETERYVEEQIEDLAPSHPGMARSRTVLRRQAADNLKAIGPAAVAAVPGLAAVAVNDADALVKRKTIEALGEIGGPQGIHAIGLTLLQTSDPEIVTAAEDALLKLLPAIRTGPRTDRKIIGMGPLDPQQRAAYMKRLPKLPFSSPRLTNDDAIFLLQVYNSGNQRVAPAIESAWAASGFNRLVVANEIKRRDKERQEKALAKARDDEAAREQRRADREQENAEKIAKLKEPSAPRGNGRVKFPDDPPYRNPLKRNANGTYNN